MCCFEISSYSWNDLGKQVTFASYVLLWCQSLEDSVAQKAVCGIVLDIRRHLHLRYQLTVDRTRHLFGPNPLHSSLSIWDACMHANPALNIPLKTQNLWSRWPRWNQICPWARSVPVLAHTPFLYQHRCWVVIQQQNKETNNRILFTHQSVWSAQLYR